MTRDAAVVSEAVRRRFEWGGVRHDEPLYAAFDLERLSVSERPEPTDEAIAISRRLLRAIESVPGGTIAPQL
jgi:hypothetical protein